MSQSTVDLAQQPIFAGVVDDNPNNLIRSYVNGEASTSIPFGVLVIDDTTADDESVLAVDDGTNQPRGIVVHSDRYAKPNELDSVGLTPGTSIGVLMNGIISVDVEDGVTALNNAVRVRHAGTGKNGGFRVAAVANETVPLNGVEWLTLGGAGSVVLLRLVGPLSFGTPDT